MLYREPKLLKVIIVPNVVPFAYQVSVLYREPKLLKGEMNPNTNRDAIVSVLYREPKLLKAIFS